MDTEVCGFPIQRELFNDEDVDFCRLPKKKCIKHISWERMKRAQVDMEIIRARLVALYVTMLCLGVWQCDEKMVRKADCYIEN